MEDPEFIKNMALPSVQEQIAAGDERAFRLLFDHYSNRLTRFSFAVVKNQEASVDIVNEVFIKIWRQREQVKEIRDMTVYLYTAVKNASLNYLSRKAHLHITAPFDCIDIRLNQAACPDQQMITAEIFSKIQAAVEELPPRCKMIFKLVREDGLKYREVAAILHVSVNTVDAQMVIAVKRIREKVKGHFDFPLRQPLKKV